MKGNDGWFYFVPLLGSVVDCELKTAFTDQKILPPVQVVCLFVSTLYQVQACKARCPVSKSKFQQTSDNNVVMNSGIRYTPVMNFG